jgi:hypothetical protein
MLLFERDDLCLNETNEAFTYLAYFAWDFIAQFMTPPAGKRADLARY